MKKTLSITLGGQLFTIEEDGYQILDQYLLSMKKHFVADQTAGEILADIESSLADKLQEKMTKAKPLVTIDDVREVIAVMGNVEEITGSSTEEETITAEPVKRLYRNPDDLVVAGVCSGVAAYTGIDVIWVRGAFIILTLINGIGLLIYLILWIVMPRAETSVQKLEMRGKHITITEIEEAVKEKTEMLTTEGKEVVGRLKQHSSVLYKIINVPIAVLKAIVSVLKKVFSSLGSVIGAIAGILLIVVATMGAAAITILGGLLLFRADSPYIVSDLPLAELAVRSSYLVGVVAIYFALLFPLIFLVVAGRSVLQRKNVFTVHSVVVVTVLWFASLTAGAVAMTDIVPYAHERAEMNAEERYATRSFEQKDFSTLALNINADVTVIYGETFAISFTGREEQLDRLMLDVKDGVLTVQEGKTKEHRICLFCWGGGLEGQITMPRLDAYRGSGASRVVLPTLSNEILINLSDVARAEAILQVGTVTTTLSDAARLSVTGKANKVYLSLKDVSRFTGEALELGSFHLNGRDASRAIISGTVVEYVADLQDVASLDALDLDAGKATIETRDAARVEVAQKEGLD